MHASFADFYVWERSVAHQIVKLTAADTRDYHRVVDAVRKRVGL